MDHVFDLRCLIRMGTVLAVDDTGGAQLATVETDDGVVHRDVEIHQLFGHASNAPLDGAVALVFAVGGDPGHLVALPVANPSARFGNQAAGEAAVYGSDGSRVHVRQGGTVDAHAANLHIVSAPTVVIQGLNGADSQVLITGNLVVTKDISDQNGAHGTVKTLRNDYNAHTHQVPNVQGGGATVTTQLPTPQDP